MFTEIQVVIALMVLLAAQTVVFFMMKEVATALDKPSKLDLRIGIHLPDSEIWEYDGEKWRLKSVRHTWYDFQRKAMIMHGGTEE